MTRDQRERLQAIARAFVDQLPAEYIEHILQDTDYVVPFEPPCKPFRWGMAGISAQRLTDIENMAINARNRFATGLLRVELKKIYQKTQ